METLVLVLTDVQGSTRLWQDESAAMDAAMARHHEIVHGAVAEHGGFRPVDQGEGDAVFAAFRSASEAIAAVARVQRELAAEPWSTSVPLQVRIGVHLGEVTERDGNLYGDPVNRCARLRGLGAGGQTLLSAAVHEVVRDKLPAGATVTNLGEHRMKDLTRPEHVWQLDLDGLPADFPPLASLDRVRHNLPVQATPFIGREAELERLIAAVREHRLVTLTGFGGMGKTRTALQAAAELVGDVIADEVFFVDLSGVVNSDDVPARVAEATRTTYDDDPLTALTAAWAATPVLLVLDNLEQVLGCAPFVAELISGTSDVRILATSREALRLRAERVISLAPMTTPSPSEVSDVTSLDTFESVRFFLDRARAVRDDFTVTNDNAPAVAAVCARLDGHPLALELAAARLRMMSVDALRTRLESALKVLTGGSRDMPARHQTLRATIAWSYEGLEDNDRLLLARMSCLPAAADFELLEHSCGTGLDVTASLEVLVDRNLVRITLDEAAETRYGLLVSIRDYAHEHLERGEAAEVRRRHAAHVLTLSTAAYDDESGFAVIAFVRRVLPHIRAALAYLASSSGAAYAELVVATADGMTANGLAVEAREHVKRALAQAPPVAVRAALMGSQNFASGAGEPDLVPKALEAARQSGQPEIIADALMNALAMAADVASLMQAAAELEANLASLDRRRASVMREETINVLAGQLRYVDPDRVVGQLRARLAEASARPAGVYRVRLARILLDHGSNESAREVLGPAEDLDDFHGIVFWLHFARAERGRLLSALGDSDAGAQLAQGALDGLVALQDRPAFAAVAAGDCYAAAGRHEELVRAMDLALELPSHETARAAMTWRRGNAHLKLGITDRCRLDLTASRDVLAADELGGPRELLGCLVTEALLVHESDPVRAALLLGSVAGHRETNLGRWVLPHSTGPDADRLEGLLLPDQQPAYAKGLAIAPQDCVRGAPL